MSSYNTTSDTQPNDYLPEFYDFSINSNVTLPTVESVSTPQGATTFIPSRSENTLNTQRSHLSILSDTFLKAN